MCRAWSKQLESEGIWAQYRMFPLFAVSASISEYVYNSTSDCCVLIHTFIVARGRRGRDHMVVGFQTTYAISTYCHSGDTTLCDQVCQ